MDAARDFVEVDAVMVANHWVLAITWALAITWHRLLVSDIVWPTISAASIAVLVAAKSIGTNRSTNRRFAIHADAMASSQATRAEAAQLPFGDWETCGAIIAIIRRIAILVHRAAAMLEF
jgi:hypothetical protein